MNREIIQNGGPQQIMQKLQQFYDKLTSAELSKYKLSELLRNTHLMQFLINRCNAFSLDINSKLQRQHKIANDITVDFQKMTKCVGNYKKEIKRFNENIENIDQKIQQLLSQKNQDLKQKKLYEKEVNELNTKLYNVIKKDFALKQNMTQNRNSLHKLQNEARKSKQFAAKLLNQIESISIKSWNRNNFIDWILSICDGYFSQNKYHTFIQSIRNTQNIIIDTQMNELLLRTWGLTDTVDINKFMINYQRLMKKQSEERIQIVNCIDI